MRFAREIAAGQYGDIEITVEADGKFSIRHRRAAPQIKSAIRDFYFSAACSSGVTASNFCL